MKGSYVSITIEHLQPGYPNWQGGRPVSQSSFTNGSQMSGLSGIPETQPKSPHITSLQMNTRPKSQDNAMLKHGLVKIRFKNSRGYFRSSGEQLLKNGRFIFTPWTLCFPVATHGHHYLVILILSL